MKQLAIAELKPWRKSVDAVTLMLPMPPGVNNLFFNLPNHGRAVTDVYRKWRHVAGLEIMRQRSGRVEGPVELAFTFEDTPRADIDGKLKAPVDLLVSMGVIDGDSSKTVRKITAAWCGNTQGARVEIRRASGLADSA